MNTEYDKICQNNTLQISNYVDLEPTNYCKIKVKY